MTNKAAIMQPATSNQQYLLTSNSNDTHRKNLLISAITNYIWDDIMPFFVSFREAGFENCECVMFTANMSQETLDELHEFGVRTIPTPEEYINSRIVLYRFDLYRKFLEDNPDKYNMILAADVRDVIFQRDLFRFYDAGEKFLGVALEDAVLSESMNAGWILSMYDSEVLDKIKDKRICCMGTVWGTYNEFLEFMRKLTHELHNTHRPYIETNDQGAANVIIYYKRAFDNVLRPSTNYDGPVVTCPNFNDGKGNITNEKGEVAAVVHMYDRRLPATKIVLDKYCKGMSQFSRLKLRYNQTFTGRVMRFMSRVHRNGLMTSILAAIKRRTNRIKRKF